MKKKTPKNIPERIYLNINTKGEPIEDFNKLHGLTWSQHPIYEQDIEYILNQPAPADPITPEALEREPDFIHSQDLFQVDGTLYRCTGVIHDEEKVFGINEHQGGREYWFPFSKVEAKWFKE